MNHCSGTTWLIFFMISIWIAGLVLRDEAGPPEIIYGSGLEAVPNGLAHGSMRMWPNRARPMSERNFSDRGHYEDSPMSRAFDIGLMPPHQFGASPNFTRGPDLPQNGIYQQISRHDNGLDSPWGQSLHSLDASIMTPAFPMRNSEADLRRGLNHGEARRMDSRSRNGSWTPPPPPPPRYQTQEQLPEPISSLIDRQSSFQVRLTSASESRLDLKVQIKSICNLTTDTQGVIRWVCTVNFSSQEYLAWEAA